MGNCACARSPAICGHRQEVTDYTKTPELEDMTEEEKLEYLKEYQRRFLVRFQF